MKDRKGVEFLQWALPKLHLRWPGFRKVRGQVLKRIDRRVEELGLSHVDEYRDYLQAHSDEWDTLGGLCRVTISRFYRDRGVFDRLVGEVLPELADRFGHLRCWSAGCASGEEAYSVALAGHFQNYSLDVLGTDIDENVLQRAVQACYPGSALKELPEEWLEAAFEARNEDFCLENEYQEKVDFQRSDIREKLPEGPFHLVLCRNLVFTYFDETLQRDTLQRIGSLMPEGAVLVVGSHEKVPSEADGFESAGGEFYRRS